MARVKSSTSCDSGYQAIGLIFHQLFGAAGIGNDDRHAGSLRFDDDVAESIGRAGKNKNVGGRIGCGQFFTREIAGKKCLGQRFG